MEPQVSSLIATTAQTGGGDRVTAYGWKALAGSVVGYAMDGFDMLIVGFMLAAISTDLALTKERRVWPDGIYEQVREMMPLTNHLPAVSVANRNSCSTSADLGPLPQDGGTC